VHARQPRPQALAEARRGPARLARSRSTSILRTDVRAPRGWEGISVESCLSSAASAPSPALYSCGAPAELSPVASRPCTVDRRRRMERLAVHSGTSAAAGERQTASGVAWQLRVRPHEQSTSALLPCAYIRGRRDVPARVSTSVRPVQLLRSGCSTESASTLSHASDACWPSPRGRAHVVRRIESRTTFPAPGRAGPRRASASRLRLGCRACTFQSFDRPRRLLQVSVVEACRARRS